MLSTQLVLPDDKEEIALTINSKKNGIERNDFEVFGKALGLSLKQMESVFSKFSNRKEKLIDFISVSFLPEELKLEYSNLLIKKLTKLKL